MAKRPRTLEAKDQKLLGRKKAMVSHARSATKRKQVRRDSK